MITLSGEDKQAHTRMTAVSPAEDINVGIWRLGDTTPSGSDVALGEFAVGPGFNGTLTISLIRAGISPGDSTVKLFRRYLDAAGNLLSEYVGSSISITAVPDDYTLTLSTAPANTARIVYGIISDMSPPGAPVRRNLFPDPRATALTCFDDRYGWGLVNGTHGSDIGGVTGLRTYASSINSNGSGSGSGRGIDIFESTDYASPRAEKRGLAVQAGQVITVSAWVYATKACTMQASARGYVGTTWSAAVTNGTATALTANTWTRLSVTITVPPGATDLCATFKTTNSVSWVANDEVRVTGLLFEVANSVQTYFDGTTKNDIAEPSSVRWEGNENVSPSLLYASAIPGSTSIEANASSLSYSTSVDELIGVSMERNLRRSVADIFNDAQSLITAGRAGLLQGQLTFICSTLAQALAADSVYQIAGLVTLTGDNAINGLTHRAVGSNRIDAEEAQYGKAARWKLIVDFREQVF